MRPYFAPGLSLKKKTNKINENMNLLCPLKAQISIIVTC